MPLSARNIRNCILCDDIRTEDNQKRILIGVYADKIVVSRLPATLHLAQYIEIYTPSVGDYNVFVRLSRGRITAKNKPLVFSAGVHVSEPEGLTTLVLPTVMVNVDKETDVRSEISFDRKKWHKLFSKPLVVGDSIIRPSL